MGLRNSSESWGIAARSLHWLAASGILWLFWLGLEQSLFMESGPERTAARATHASWALIVLMIMTIRIVWRVGNKPPVHPAGLANWQKGSASIVHWGLYLVVFAQLTSGAMTVATKGQGLPFFGATLPVPIAKNDAGHKFWEEIHEVTWWALAALLTVHVLGALYNHFVNKNDVLKRMVGVG